MTGPLAKRTIEIAARLGELKERGIAVLSTRNPNLAPVVADLDGGSFMGWRTQCLTYLRNVFGESHTYSTSFKESTDRLGHSVEVQRGMAILGAAAEDVEAGYLARVTDLITSDVFTDFLELAEHILEAGHKDPAAMLIGAVLEDGLRRITVKAGLPVKSRDDLTALAGRCAEKNVFTRLMAKKLSVWIDVRNNAAHGQFDQYNNDDVKSMLEGVTVFLSEYIG